MVRAFVSSADTRRLTTRQLIAEPAQPLANAQHADDHWVR